MSKLSDKRIEAEMAIICACREQLDKFKKQAIKDGGFYANIITTSSKKEFCVIVTRNMLTIKTPDFSIEDYKFIEVKEGPIAELYKEISENYLSPEENQELGYLTTLADMFN